MRKGLLFIFLLIPGLIVLAVLYGNHLKTCVSAENSFRVSDTVAVSRIEILSNDSIILTRKGFSWELNGESTANPVAVNNFLFSFSRMGIKGIDQHPGLDDEKGLRIKIFEGRKKHFLRFYQIDSLSFMNKEGSKKLYAVEVDGFSEIKLARVIRADVEHWKNKILLDIHPGNIREVSVIHPLNPENDFRIKILNGKPELFNGAGIEIPRKNINLENMNFYLSYFGNIFYDYEQNEESQELQLARWIVKIEEIDGNKYELIVFPIKKAGAEDMFRARVKYNGQTGYKVTRFMVLDLLLQDLSHFKL